MYDLTRVPDPLQLVSLCWPKVRLYDKQKEILYSLWENDETTVPAGNQLGKDFVSALAILIFFISRHPCRVVSTSVDEGQLEKVLWGELKSFVETSEVNLPLKVNHLDIRKVVNGGLCPKSYIVGRVAKKEEGLLGHHLPRGPGNRPHTAMVYDEASGIPNDFKVKTDTWAHRTLIIGNPYECENFFKNDSEAGDVPRPDGQPGFYRRVIRIRAIDSPNVRYAMGEIRRLKKSGLPPIPSGEILIPGVLDYAEYLKRRTLWDEIRQCISLDAQFYKGAGVLMFPPAWMDRAERYAEEIASIPRKAKGVGVDPAEGGDDTCFAASDEMGLLALESCKTPDTNVIPAKLKAFIEKWGGRDFDYRNVMIDRGGGGKQLADRMRASGYPVQTIAFGESLKQDLRQGHVPFAQRSELEEARYVYKNRRALLYGLARTRLDPEWGTPFALPSHLVNNTQGGGKASLRRQLSVIPLAYDGEGRLELPPKQRRPGDKTQRKTLSELIGCSPDEADAFVLSNYVISYKPRRAKAGVAF